MATTQVNYSEAATLTQLINLLREIDRSKSRDEIGAFVNAFISKFAEYLRDIKNFRFADVVKVASAHASQREADSSAVDLEKIATAFVFRESKMSTD